jgi:hypothetical protein
MAIKEQAKRSAITVQAPPPQSLVALDQGRHAPAV